MIEAVPSVDSDIVFTKRKYVVGGRNGYYAIDEHTHDGCTKLVDTFKTRKQAQATANDLSSAYCDGILDAHVGLTLPLYRECTHTAYTQEGKVTVIPAGTKVTVLRKDFPAFFDCRVVQTGLVFSCQFTDLRAPIPGMKD